MIFENRLLGRFGSVGNGFFAREGEEKEDEEGGEGLLAISSLNCIYFLSLYLWGLVRAACMGSRFHANL